MLQVRSIGRKTVRVIAQGTYWLEMGETDQGFGYFFARMPSLRKHFDKDLILSSDSGALLTQSKVSDMEKALEIESVEVPGEMYHVVGSVIEEFAGECETCDCHSTLYRRNVSKKRRRTAIRLSTGKKTCVWAGRRLAWFIAVGYAKFKENIRTCTSPKLQQLLVEMPRAARAKIIVALERLRLALIALFDDKFHYIFHIPYLVVGAFYCTQGGSDEVARSILLLAMVEYDTAIADGRGNMIKGLAQTWFAPLSRVRQQMEAFSSSTLSLESYPLLFISLQEYALLAIVEDGSNGSTVF